MTLAMEGTVGGTANKEPLDLGDTQFPEKEVFSSIQSEEKRVTDSVSVAVRASVVDPSSKITQPKSMSHHSFGQQLSRVYSVLGHGFAAFGQSGYARAEHHDHRVDDAMCERALFSHTSKPRTAPWNSVSSKLGKRGGMSGRPTRLRCDMRRRNDF